MSEREKLFWGDTHYIQVRVVSNDDSQKAFLIRIPVKFLPSNPQTR